MSWVVIIDAFTFYSSSIKGNNNDKKKGGYLEFTFYSSSIKGQYLLQRL